MDLELLKETLKWCAILNYGILLLWFGIIAWGRNWIHRFHGRWFPMSQENMILLHYLMFGLYKLGIFLFNLMPFIVLSFLT